jgi:hypothetical protein
MTCYRSPRVLQTGATRPIHISLRYESSQILLRSICSSSGETVVRVLVPPTVGDCTPVAEQGRSPFMRCEKSCSNLPTIQLHPISATMPRRFCDFGSSNLGFPCRCRSISQRENKVSHRPAEIQFHEQLYFYHDVSRGTRGAISPDWSGLVPRAASL